jgi:hypothetical protein
MIKLTNILKGILVEEKKKRDRCLRIADRKYDKPSAYKSGAVVKCRQGKIWKDIKEEINASEAYSNEDAIQTIIDGKRDLGFLTIIGSGARSDVQKETIRSMINDNDLKTIEVKGNKHQAYIVFKKGAEKKAKELKDIAEKYGGYLSYKATDDETRRIGKLLGYTKKDIEDYIEHIRRTSVTTNEEESLHKWFNRQGPKGKEKGWVDCNAPDSKGGYKACGRKEGEKRSKYPACRPTAAQCKTKGKGNTWGKTK